MELKEIDKMCYDYRTLNEAELVGQGNFGEVWRGWSEGLEPEGYRGKRTDVSELVILYIHFQSCPKSKLSFCRPFSSFKDFPPSLFLFQLPPKLNHLVQIVIKKVKMIGAYDGLIDDLWREKDMLMKVRLLNSCSLVYYVF